MQPSELEGKDVTDVLTHGAAVITKSDVPDELPEAFTVEVVDGEGVADADA